MIGHELNISMRLEIALPIANTPYTGPPMPPMMLGAFCYNPAIQGRGNVRYGVYKHEIIQIETLWDHHGEDNDEFVGRFLIGRGVVCCLMMLIFSPGGRPAVVVLRRQDDERMAAGTDGMEIPGSSAAEDNQDE